MDNRRATLNRTLNMLQKPPRGVVLKLSQHCDGFTRIHLFAVLHFRLCRLIAHVGPVATPAVCNLWYRSRNASRPRLTRIFAADRPMPKV